MPAIKKNQFKVGDTVFGLWPGSGGLYFKAVVVESNAKDGTYELKFEEGTTYSLPEKHVKAVDNFKTLEPKSSQRQVSRRRARSSSASRSRSRSRTPGRKPGRPRSSPEKKEPRQKSKTVDPDVLEDIPLATRRSARTKPEPKTVEAVEDVPLSRRRSTRIATKTEKAAVEAKKEEEAVSTSAEEIKPNGNDSTIPKDVESDTDDAKADGSPGALPAILHTLSILFGVVFLYLTCQHNKCLFTTDIQGLVSKSNLLALYNQCSSLSVAGFYLVTFLLSLIPTGAHQSLRRNAMGSLAFVLSFLASKNYYNLTASTILNKLPQFLLPNILVGFLVAVLIAYQTRGLRANTGLIAHFFTGASTTVSLAGVNVKIWLNRAVALTTIVLNCLALEASFEKNQALSHTLVLVAVCQIVYSFELLWNESNMLHSYEFVNIKTGWMYLLTLSNPLLLFIITHIITVSGINLPYYTLAPIGVLFLAGLVIKIGSTAQKVAFGNDPENTLFADMETLTSVSGEKLLISGWWGKLRHPNYLGDILMHWAFVLPCGFQLLLPHTVALFMTLCFIYRSLESDSVGKMKYGPSWDRYVNRVPSRLIPRVF